MYFKFLSSKPQYDRENDVWRTKTGRIVPISWMTNTHINNCLNCLRGEGESEIPDIYMGRTKDEWTAIFECELNTRRLAGENI